MAKLPSPTEYTECVWLADYLRLLQRQHKIVLFSHIPNETYTPSFAARNRNKAQGVDKGVPDYIIVTQEKVFFIEMKRVTGSRVSQEQIAWSEALESVGIDVFLCYGFVHAKEVIDQLI